MTHSKRPETGPMQFGDDWPGVFMRGDNAVTASILLLEALSKIQRTGVLDALELAQLHGLARDLGSADVRAGAPVQQLQSWDQCVRLGTMSKTILRCRIQSSGLTKMPKGKILRVSNSDAGPCVWVFTDTGSSEAEALVDRDIRVFKEGAEVVPNGMYLGSFMANAPGYLVIEEMFFAFEWLVNP